MDCEFCESIVYWKRVELIGNDCTCAFLEENLIYDCTISGGIDCYGKLCSNI